MEEGEEETGEATATAAEETATEDGEGKPLAEVLATATDEGEVEPAADTAAPAEATHSFEKIVNELVAADDKPAWFEQLEFEAAGKGVKEFVLDGDPSTWDVRKLVYNLVQRQVANTAALDAELETRAKATADLAAEKRQVAKTKSNVAAYGANERLKAYVDRLTPKTPQPDPFTTEGVLWLVNKGIAEGLSGFMGEWETIAKTQQEAIEAEEQAANEASVTQAAAAYMTKFEEDFKNDVVFERIKPLFQAFKGTMPMDKALERAHRLVLTELATEEDKDHRDKAMARARGRLRPGSGKRPGVPPTPKFKTSAETIQFYEDNPDALKRDSVRQD